MFVKLLCFEGDGYAVYYKILAEGTIEIPRPGGVDKPGGACATISPETLRLILGGVKLASIKRRKRYRKAA